jgi:hypothetical protein
MKMLTTERFNKIAHGICGSLAGLSIGILFTLLIPGKTLADTSGFAIGGVFGASLFYISAFVIRVVQNENS